MLSDNLKIYREQKDMTQEDVAKRLNIKVGTLTYICGSLHAFHWNLKNWVLF